MGEWREQQLCELVDISSSKRIFYNEYVSVGIPFYRSKEIIEKHNGKTISTELQISIEKYNDIKEKFGVPVEGDLLLTSVGTLGIPYIVQKDENFYFKDGNLTWFRNFNNSLLNKFLYYWIISPIGKSEIDMVSIGSTQPALTIMGLKGIIINIAPLAEQRAIASVLSSLDDKIDLLHRENKTLEAIAGILFRQWFVEEASDDWEEILLNDIYMFDKGFEPGSRNYLENKEADSIRFIRVGDMLDLKASTYIKKEPGQITCGKKDLLVSFDGTIGRVSFGLEGAYSSGIRKVYSLNPVYNSLGLKYLLFTSREIQDVIKSHSSGTVIAHAGSSIDYLTFRFPKKNRLQEFNQITDPMFFKITKNLDQIETLEKLRNNLLPKLISGEVRVKI